MVNPLRQLRDLGQSVWFDNIERAMLFDGRLLHMVENDGLAGMTSNPTIFAKAMATDASYKEGLKALLAEDPEADEKALFYRLAIEDIQHAADILRPVYERSGHQDGMVSLEVSPDLAYDAEATVLEAEDLVARVDRPNLMIKVPATRPGLKSIEQLIAKGINVNATLLFSVQRYEQVADAFILGLETRLRQGLPVEGIASVASFFVSRVDSKVDGLLDEKAERSGSAAEREVIESLRGRTAIANAGLAYLVGKARFGGERFAALRDRGAAPQRLLWASTGTKNPAYSDVLYVEELIAPETVNTMPPATYEAFRDHGVVEPRLDRNAEQATETLSRLGDIGIDLDAVTDELEVAGVRQFSESFEELLATIGESRQRFLLGKAS